jgi:hypothetical protein
MDATRIHLPGGLVFAGSLVSWVDLGPLTGHVEEALCDWLQGMRPGPPGVDNVLNTAGLALAGQAVDTRLPAALCVADRQWLLLSLLRQIDARPWLNVRCPECGAPFDLQVLLDDWPCSAAGAGFPLAQTTLGEQAVCLRVPTGADQAAIASLAPLPAALVLLNACVVSVGGSPPLPEWLPGLSEADLKQLDAALDAVAPQLASEIRSTCPECGQAVGVQLQPHTLLPLRLEPLLDEVCRLAAYNHWREREILDLPRARRQLYLARVQHLQAQDRGWARPE